MPQVIWLPQALRDVERLYRFLNQTSPQTAKKAAQTILQAAEPLKDFPEPGLPLPDKRGYREIYAAFGNGAYVIRYRIFDRSHAPRGNASLGRSCVLQRHSNCLGLAGWNGTLSVSGCIPTRSVGTIKRLSPSIFRAPHYLYPFYRFI